MAAAMSLAEEVYPCRTVVFAGTTPNIGTTVVAFGTALSLAKNTHKQIAYLCLNLKSSKIHHYLSIDQPAFSLDKIRTELKTRTLTPARLRPYCVSMKQWPNLHVLVGNLYREQAEYYTPSDIEHLLKIAARAFDVCIVDVNAYWDNAATVSALLASDLKVLVTSDQLAHFQEDLSQWMRTGYDWLNMTPDLFHLFINQQHRQHGGYSHKDIKRETGLSIIGWMNGYEQLPSFLNRGKLEEFFMENPSAESSFDSIVQHVIHENGWIDKRKVEHKHLKRRLFLIKHFSG